MTQTPTTPPFPDHAPQKTDATIDMKVFREEIFGPVTPVFKFSSDEEVIQLANDTEYGLASYFFTKARGVGGFWGGRPCRLGAPAGRRAFPRAQPPVGDPAVAASAGCRRSRGSALHAPTPPPPFLLLLETQKYDPPLLQDLARAWKVAEALEFGMVGVNEVAFTSEVSPFGGIKQSGLGREESKYGLDEFLVMKTVCMGVGY